MANRSSKNSHHSPEGLITLKALQAAARGVHGRASVRWEGIRIYSCNSSRPVKAAKAVRESDESPAEFLVRV